MVSAPKTEQSGRATRAVTKEVCRICEAKARRTATGRTALLTEPQARLRQPCLGLSATTRRNSSEASEVFKRARFLATATPISQGRATATTGNPAAKTTARVLVARTGRGDRCAATKRATPTSKETCRRALCKAAIAISSAARYRASGRPAREVAATKRAGFSSTVPSKTNEPTVNADYTTQRTLTGKNTPFIPKSDGTLPLLIRRTLQTTKQKSDGNPLLFRRTFIQNVVANVATYV